MLISPGEVEETRLSGICPDATRVGPFLFISSQTAVDPATGAFVTGAGDLSADERAKIEAHHDVGEPEWPIAAQTWAIYRNLEWILERHGATLDNLARTNTFFRDLNEFPAMERVRARLLPKAPPASTVVQMTDRGLHPDVRLIVDGVAVVPDAAYPGIVKAPVLATLNPTAHFSTAVVAGQLIWPAGQVAYDPVTREMVRSLDDLPAEAAWLVTGNKHLDVREGRVLAQAWRCYDNLRLILEAAGGTLHDLVKETIWLRDLRHLPAVERIRKHLFPTAASAPATSVLQVGDLGRASDTLMEVDAIGLLPREGGWRRDPVVGVEGVRPLVHGPAAVKAGPLVFTSGVIGLKGGQVVRSLSELSEKGRALQLGRPYREPAALAQTDQALGAVETILRAAGSSPDRAVYLNVYGADYGDLPEVERVLGVRFGNRPPAGRTLALPGVDVRGECHVKIDAVALGE